MNTAYFSVYNLKWSKREICLKTSTDLDLCDVIAGVLACFLEHLLLAVLFHLVTFLQASNLLLVLFDLTETQTQRYKFTRTRC